MMQVTFFIQKITEVIDIYALEKVLKYIDCLASVNLIKYRNIYNKFKKIAKQKLYADKLFEYKNDFKNIWQTYNTIIGRNVEKKSISDMFSI